MEVFQDNLSQWSATRKASEMCPDNLNLLLDVLNIKLVLTGDDNPEDFDSRKDKTLKFWYVFKHSIFLSFVLDIFDDSHSKPLVAGMKETRN